MYIVYMCSTGTIQNISQEGMTGNPMVIYHTTIKETCLQIACTISLSPFQRKVLKEIICTMHHKTEITKSDAYNVLKPMFMSRWLSGAFVYFRALCNSCFHIACLQNHDVFKCVLIKKPQQT